MKRSFAENVLQKHAGDNKAQLAEYQTQLSSLEDSACNVCTFDVLRDAYDASAEIIHLTYAVQAGIVAHGLKFLSPGRVVVLNSPLYRNCIAVLLRVENQRGGTRLGRDSSKVGCCQLGPPQIRRRRESIRCCYGW